MARHESRVPFGARLPTGSESGGKAGCLGRPYEPGAVLKNDVNSY